jgi:PAS domain S-box-containing protein
MLNLAQAAATPSSVPLHALSYTGIAALLLFIVWRLTRTRRAARASQRQLARREQQLAEAQAIAHLGSWEWDVAANRVQWSDELYRIYGIDPSVPINYQTFLDAVHEDDRERVMATVHSALEQGHRFEFRHQLRRPNGDVRVLHARGHVIRDENARPIRMVGTALDVTEQLAAERQQQQLEFEHVARVEAETNAKEMQILADGGAILSNSLDYDETLQNAARVLIPALGDVCIIDVIEDGKARRAAVAHVDSRLQQSLRGTLPFAPDLCNDKHPAVRALNARRPVVVSGHANFRRFAQNESQAAVLEKLKPQTGLFFPLVSPRGALGVISVFTGAERRYTNRELILGEELARRVCAAIEHALVYRDAQLANRAKASFLGVMSHELRTPLNAVLGYADLLDAGVGGSLSDLQREHVRRIMQASGHLSRIVEEILSYTRLEAGREVIRRELIDVNDVAREAVRMIEPAASAKQLDLHFTPAAVSAMADTDATKLRQIFANLLSNAVKFTDTGSIIFTVEVVDTEVVCSLRDTGIGIHREHLPQIFDAFWQAEHDRTRRAGGTGLGLAVTRKLAQLLGAGLSVESEVGIGTEFCLRIPAVKLVTSGQ